MREEIKISIRNRYTGSVLFEYSSVDNTIAKTVMKAAESGICLRRADLHGAELYGVDLYGVDLRGIDLYGAGLRGANLCGTNLRSIILGGADLCNTNMSDADMFGAIMFGAIMRGAIVRGANMRGANMRGADMRDADMRGANMRGANMHKADMHKADLSGAIVRGADMRDTIMRGAVMRGVDMRGAVMRDADMRSARGGYMACPSEGSFVGWEKTAGRVVKLLIPEDARRNSAGAERGRCDKAYVVEIQNTDGTRADIEAVVSDHDSNFIYTLGSTIEVPGFDDNRWNECAPGIHFFIDRRAAVEYKQREP